MAYTIMKIIPTSNDIPSALSVKEVPLPKSNVPKRFTANKVNNVAAKEIAPFLNPC